MADRLLLEAFDDCINRMAAGQSINDCLRSYPEFAAALRPMLEVGKLVERSQPGTFEVATAQERVRTRIVERLQAPPHRRSYARWMAVAASMLLALVAVFGAAESSLPGDMLYNLKRFGEEARGAVLGEQFATRRLDEIRVLLALRRAEDVEFEGEVASVEGASWVIAGLTSQVSADIPGADQAAVGDQVRVEAYTTENGDLIARALTVVREGEHSVIPSATPVFVVTSTATATHTVTPTSTPSATATPTFTLTSSPSATVTPTLTLTSSPSPSPALTATSTTMNTLTPVPSTFAPQPPTSIPLNPPPTEDDHGGDDHGGNSGPGGGDDSGDDGDDDNSGSGSD